MALLHRECEERWDRRGAMDDTRIGEWVGSGEGAIMELGQGYAGWTRVDRKKGDSLGDGAALLDMRRDS